MTRLSYNQNKYRNIITEIDSQKFHSKKEAARFQELKLMERARLIRNLQTQVEFVLIEPFIYRGQKIRGVSYYADFVYLNENDEMVVEDVKSEITRKDSTYIIKKKLLLKLYPHINFIET